MSDQPKVLKLGDNINTDDIIPTTRCTSTDPDFLKNYVLEYVIGEGKLLEYDEIEAGRNFGCGSSREVAPLGIKAAGIKAVRAQSFADIFYRNSINIGLAVSTPNEDADPVRDGIVEAGGLFPYNRKRRDGEVKPPAGVAQARSMTMVEKILARASGNAYVQPGETVFAGVDLAMAHDATTELVAKLFHQHFGADAKVWDKQKVALVADHFIQVNDIRHDPRADSMYRYMVDFAKEQDARLFDMVGPGDAQGICHVLLPEKGLVAPGMVIAGTDSHTCSYGAFGCFSTGVGNTDMANIFAMGDLWIKVPPTLRINLDGTLPADLSAKDVILLILGRLGCERGVGRVLEFHGSAVDAMPIDERFTLANMAVECGALCGLIPPNQETLDYLKARAADSNQHGFEPVLADGDAVYEAVYDFDLTDMVPQVACPPRPDNVVGVNELNDTIIHSAFIGSCTGGKLHDLAEAARVLDGRKVAPGVNLFVAPASQEVRSRAAELGYLQIFEAAGARILNPGCGACINAGRGSLDKDQVGISAINRNFRGRSGHADSKTYLASPRIVAVSAVRGRITDALD